MKNERKIDGYFVSVRSDIERTKFRKLKSSQLGNSKVSSKTDDDGFGEGETTTR